jgi:hypothetical protein
VLSGHSDTAGCALFADDIILVFLGPRWNNAATSFVCLPGILVFAFTNPSQSDARERARLEVRITRCSVWAMAWSSPTEPSVSRPDFRQLARLPSMPVLLSKAGILDHADRHFRAARPALVSVVLATAATVAVQ